MLPFRGMNQAPRVHQVSMYSLLSVNRRPCKKSWMMHAGGAPLLIDTLSRLARCQNMLVYLDTVLTHASLGGPVASAFIQFLLGSRPGAFQYAMSIVLVCSKLHVLVAVLHTCYTDSTVASQSVCAKNWEQSFFQTASCCIKKRQTSWCLKAFQGDPGAEKQSIVHAVKQRVFLSRRNIEYLWLPESSSPGDSQSLMALWQRL